MTDREQVRDREEAAARFQQKREAYVSLFGTLGKPTPLGKIVLDDLDRFCTTFDESIHMDKQGRMDPYTTIYRDGKKAVALRIREMINWSESNDDSG